MQFPEHIIIFPDTVHTLVRESLNRTLLRIQGPKLVFTLRQFQEGLRAMGPFRWAWAQGLYGSLDIGAVQLELLILIIIILITLKLLTLLLVFLVLFVDGGIHISQKILESLLNMLLKIILSSELLSFRSFSLERVPCFQLKISYYYPYNLVTRTSSKPCNY